MHLKIVEETEWDAAGEVRDPSCPKHDNSLFSNQIKSNHFYCHITTAQVPWWVKFLWACSRQCKKTTDNLPMDRQCKKQQTIYLWTDSAKNNKQFTYGQTVQKKQQTIYIWTDSAKKQQTIYLWTDSAKKQQTIYIWTDSAKKLHWSIYSAPDSAKKQQQQFTYGQTVQKKQQQFTYGQTVQKTTAIYIWTVHIYRLYRRQCAKYTYIYSVRLVYYRDILNYQRHIIHRMGTSTLCTVSIHNVVYT